MPLVKQYDRTDVLDRAMHAFWARGYEATSIGDLVKKTGLNRASLYTAFKGKRGLFLACLAHYDARHRENFLGCLQDELPPRDAILAAFDAATRPGNETDLPPGCLLVNTALEVSPHDPEIREKVNACLSEVETFFRKNIRAARAAGTVPDHVDPDKAAKVLLGLFTGLRVFVRAGMDRAAVSAVINQARAVLT